MTLALALGALLAIGCVLLVALPYLREPAAADDRLDQPGELDPPSPPHVPEPYPPPGELDPPQTPPVPRTE